jgi:hypothetical protein
MLVAVMVAVIVEVVQCSQLCVSFLEIFKVRGLSWRMNGLHGCARL